MSRRKCNNLDIWTMYCIILYNESFLNPEIDQSVEVEVEDKLLYINPDCPIKIILDYIRSSIGIDTEIEFDVCTLNGELKYVHTYEEFVYGTAVFEPFGNYVCVLIEKNEEGAFINIIPLTNSSGLVNKLHKKYSIKKSIDSRLASL